MSRGCTALRAVVRRCLWLFPSSSTSRLHRLRSNQIEADPFRRAGGASGSGVTWCAVDDAVDETGPDSEYRAVLGQHGRPVFGHEGGICHFSEGFVADLFSNTPDNHCFLGAFGGQRAVRSGGQVPCFARGATCTEDEPAADPYPPDRGQVRRAPRLRPWPASSAAIAPIGWWPSSTTAAAVPQLAVRSLAMACVPR